MLIAKGTVNLSDGQGYLWYDIEADGYFVVYETCLTEIYADCGDAISAADAGKWED